MTATKSFRMALCLQILVLATAYSEEHFCGPRLTEMMQIVCRNKYASLASMKFGSQKRSDGGEDNAYIDNEGALTYPTFPYQFYPMVSGYGSTTDLSSRFRRDLTAVKRGVIEECCRKPCSLLVLSTYCGV